MYLTIRYLRNENKLSPYNKELTLHRVWDHMHLKNGSQCLWMSTLAKIYSSNYKFMIIKHHPAKLFTGL